MTSKEMNEMKEGTVIQIEGFHDTLMKTEGYLSKSTEKIPFMYDGKRKAYTEVTNIVDYKVITDAELLYSPVPVRFNKEFDYGSIDINKNFQSLKEIDEKQKNKKSILYRYLKFPYADGFAVYQIVEIKRDQVRVMHCSGLGDDWELDDIGNGDFVSRKMAENHILRRDSLNAFYTKKEKQEIKVEKEKKVI